MTFYDPTVDEVFDNDYIEIETPFTTVRSQSHLEGVTHLNQKHSSWLDGRQIHLPMPDVHQRMSFLLPSVLVIIVLMALGIWILLRNSSEIKASVEDGQMLAMPAQVQTAVALSGGQISPIFTPEVQYWAPNIVKWANQFNLDPNMVATVMQIESCGDPQAISRSNAQGLFQVMPFHFAAGENMLDPDTNARRGMNYLAERLVQTNGEVGHAFAGYNGGHVAAGSNWENWANETQRYYTWSTGIYGDSQTEETSSQTLDQWLNAGGRSLCNQAAARLGLQ